MAEMKLDQYLGVSGRVAVVTGAAGGIGSAITRSFVEAGIKVVAVDIVPQEKILSIIPELSSSEHLVIQTNVGKVANCEAIVAHTLEKYGRLDILVNAAAVLKRVPIDDVTEELWDEIMSANLKSQYFLSRAASNPMREQKWGRIINFSSQGAYTGGLHSSSVYNTAKGGILTITRSFARLLAPHGICVNAVAPGGVKTPMMAMSPEQVAEFVSLVPLGRMAEPEEMASITLFLASEAARYITGTTIDASGGQLMK